MTERIKKLFAKVPTVILATASADGIPNAVPVGAKYIVDDETILLSDQFFNKSLVNLKTNPRMAVTFWKGHEGYQLKGKVTIETQGHLYETTAKLIREKGSQMGFSLQSKGIVLLKIDEIFGVAPGPGAGTKIA